MLNKDKKTLIKYNVTVEQVAKMLGYRTEMAFRNSTAFNRLIEGVCNIIRTTRKEIYTQISNVFNEE